MTVPDLGRRISTLADWMFEVKFRKKRGNFRVEVFPAAIVIDGKFEHWLSPKVCPIV